MLISRIFVSCTILFAIGGNFSPVAAKPPGPSVLGEVTITEGKKSHFFTEGLFPVVGNSSTHYGLYGRGHTDIGGKPSGDAGGYIQIGNFLTQKCGLTLFGGVTVTEALFTAKSRLFCQF